MGASQSGNFSTSRRVMHEPRGASRLYCPINQNEPSLATDCSRWRGSRNEIDRLLTITRHENSRPWSCASFKDGIEHNSSSSKIYQFLDFSLLLRSRRAFFKNCDYIEYIFNTHIYELEFIRWIVKIIFISLYRSSNIFRSKGWRIVKTHLYSGIYHRDFYSRVWWTKSGWE